MNRVGLIIAATCLGLGGTAFAQSVEPPSLSGLGSGLGGAITGTIDDAFDGTPGGGFSGFLDPESGGDDNLDPESGGPQTGNDDSERRRPLDIAVIGPVDTQGVILVCTTLQAGGNPMDGLNLPPRPKNEKQKKAEMRCKVVSKYADKSNGVRRWLVFS